MNRDALALMSATAFVSRNVRSILLQVAEVWLAAISWSWEGSRFTYTSAYSKHSTTYRCSFSATVRLKYLASELSSLAPLFPDILTIPQFRGLGSGGAWLMSLCVNGLTSPPALRLRSTTAPWQNQVVIKTRYDLCFHCQMHWNWRWRPGKYMRLGTSIE